MESNVRAPYLWPAFTWHNKLWRPYGQTAGQTWGGGNVKIHTVPWAGVYTVQLPNAAAGPGTHVPAAQIYSYSLMLCGTS